MALLGGSAGLGKQLAGMAALMAPKKMTQTGALAPLDFGVPSGMDPAESGITPGKITSFGPMSGGTTAFDAYDPSTKINPASLFAPPTPASVPTNATAPQQMGGGLASLGGDWSGVDQWNGAIAAAAKQYGVPANLIKAVMKLESNGDVNATGAPGVWGPMQVYGAVWGDGPWMHDPVANIMKGAEILAGAYHDNGNDWGEALRHYHGIGSDGYTTDTQYRDIVMGNWDTLNARTGGGTAGTGYAPTTGLGAGGGGNVTQLFGPGAAVYDWGEFNAPSGNGLYGYGTAYGLNGSNHTGLDVAMPVGTPMFAPMSGTVTCAGSGNGPGADGGGCAAFGCVGYCNGTAGRVEIQLDNGVVLIYGHASTAALSPGARVNAGTMIGTSGGMNSPHVHLEARVRDASMPSGWRIVDPRTVLGGGSFVQQPGGTNYGGTTPSVSQPVGFRQGLRAFQQSRL